jgi:hypothetical protein
VLAQLGQPGVAERLRGPDHGGVTGAGGRADLLGGGEDGLTGMAAQVLGDQPLGP